LADRKTGTNPGAAGRPASGSIAVVAPGGGAFSAVGAEIDRQSERSVSLNPIWAQNRNR